MSTDMALVARTKKNQGIFKLRTNMLGKTMIFPAGTVIVSATGPHPGDLRYGEADSSLLLKHADIPETVEGLETPTLDPEIKECKGGWEIVAWVKKPVETPEGEE